MGLPETVHTTWLIPIGLFVIIAWLDGGNRARREHIRDLEKHLDYMRTLLPSEDR